MGSEPLRRGGTGPGAAARMFPRPRRGPHCLSPASSALTGMCRVPVLPALGSPKLRHGPLQGLPALTGTDPVPRGIAQPRPSPLRGPPSLMETRYGARPCVPDGCDSERTGREDRAAVPAGSGGAHAVPVPRVSSPRAGRDRTGLAGGISLPAWPGEQPEGQLPTRFIYLFRHRVINS